MSIGWNKQQDKSEHIRCKFNKVFVNGVPVTLKHLCSSVEVEFQAKPGDMVEVDASVYEVIKVAIVDSISYNAQRQNAFTNNKSHY
jgi:hypothetical protein